MIINYQSKIGTIFRSRTIYVCLLKLILATVLCLKYPFSIYSSTKKQIENMRLKMKYNRQCFYLFSTKIPYYMQMIK